MKKTLVIILLILSTFHTTICQEIPSYDHYTIVDTVSGDLDKDLNKELVVIFNKGTDDEINGVPREIIIYKLEDGKWVVWKRSEKALFGSMDGGMMGDPYGEMEIKNGILHISQNGGSSYKWTFTDKYRFQDGEFYLIGYSSISGKLCEYWETVDFNLSTGKMIINKEYEDCDTEDQAIFLKENETIYEKGLKITLQNRQEKEIKITTPVYGYQIFIATGQQ